jgi:hypothetical protein
MISLLADHAGQRDDAGHAGVMMGGDQLCQAARLRTGKRSDSPQYTAWCGQAMMANEKLEQPPVRKVACSALGR